MIEYVLDAVRAAGVDHILVVVGYRAEDVRRALGGHGDITFVDQARQLGTGHAVAACRDHLSDHDGPILVVTGDSPLTQHRSIAKLLDLYRRERPACILGTSHKEDPRGLGRIVRNPQGQFMGIVEEKDATPEQRQITEVNMSTYVFDCQPLLRALQRLNNDNQSGEYYITDCPGILQSEGKDVRGLAVLEPCESLSVNCLDELHVVEAEMRRSR
jgi:bifunctional UDP-N-acetylglucosamine pyrophosphorylase/glucosamine-1-phosphate N-acetyltransferase/UDP-N-acetylglucosamine pyrophosphorylase